MGSTRLDSTKRLRHTAKADRLTSAQIIQAVNKTLPYPYYESALHWDAERRLAWLSRYLDRQAERLGSRSAAVSELAKRVGRARSTIEVWSSMIPTRAIPWELVEILRYEEDLLVLANGEKGK